jgi:AcrR family transcriptional regulator
MSSETGTWGEGGRLLQRIEPPDFSIHAVAAEAGISVATAYQYFRSPGRVLTALSQRYFADSPIRSGGTLSARVSTLEQFDALLFERARLVRVACSRTFLPERLELRTTVEPESGPGTDR